MRKGKLDLFLLFVVFSLVVIAGLLFFIVSRGWGIFGTVADSVVNVNLGQYPVNQDFADKMNLSGLTALYQVKKNDMECRSIVFSGREVADPPRTSPKIVLSIYRVGGTDEYYVRVKEIDLEDKIQFRFIPSKTSVIVDTYVSDNDDLRRYQRLSTERIMDLMVKGFLVRRGDVIGTSSRVEFDENGDPYYIKDDQGNLIIGELIIRRCEFL